MALVTPDRPEDNQHDKQEKHLPLSRTPLEDEDISALEKAQQWMAQTSMRTRNVLTQTLFREKPYSDEEYTKAIKTPALSGDLRMEVQEPFEELSARTERLYDHIFALTLGSLPAHINLYAAEPTELYDYYTEVRRDITDPKALQNPHLLFQNLRQLVASSLLMGENSHGELLHILQKLEPHIAPAYLHEYEELLGYLHLLLANRYASPERAELLISDDERHRGKGLIIHEEIGFQHLQKALKELDPLIKETPFSPHKPRELAIHSTLSELYELNGFWTNAIQERRKSCGGDSLTMLAYLQHLHLKGAPIVAMYDELAHLYTLQPNSVSILILLETLFLEHPEQFRNDPLQSKVLTALRRNISLLEDTRTIDAAQIAQRTLVGKYLYEHHHYKEALVILEPCLLSQAKVAYLKLNTPETEAYIRNSFLYTGLCRQQLRDFNEARSWFEQAKAFEQENNSYINGLIAECNHEKYLRTAEEINMLRFDNNMLQKRSRNTQQTITKIEAHMQQLQSTPGNEQAIIDSKLLLEAQHSYMEELKQEHHGFLQNTEKMRALMHAISKHYPLTADEASYSTTLPQEIRSSYLLLMDSYRVRGQEEEARLLSDALTNYDDMVKAAQKEVRLPQTRPSSAPSTLEKSANNQLQDGLTLPH